MGVWVKERMVGLGLSNTLCLLLYHTPKFLRLLPDTILSFTVQDDPLLHLHTNPHSLFNIQCIFAFLLSDFCSLLKQWVNQFTQRCDFSWRGKSVWQTFSQWRNIFSRISYGWMHTNYFLLSNWLLCNRNISLSLSFFFINLIRIFQMKEMGTG